MVNIKSSKKRILQSEKKRKYNISQRSMMKTFIKKSFLSICSGDKKDAEYKFCLLQSILDRQVSKGLLHKNKAARYKSVLISKINLM
ncbi:MAG: 30S ribosomal subunit protein S20 [Candidatus Westeberhardia cardiocondylae]|nr:30S ribosomal subunit protein S20 [Candidatus Westeberhardia cardiocondylae]